MSNWNQLPSEEILNQTVQALKDNGMDTEVFNNEQDLKNKIYELLPKGAEVMTMSSVTLDTLGISSEIDQSKDYDPVRVKLYSMDRETQKVEMQKLGAAPVWVLGSVHALTKDGKAVIASASGSQLPAYAYGSSNVIWVVGAQKIVDNVDDALKRIDEYILPLESERVKKVYGFPRSSVNKLLIMNKEQPGRIKILILNKEIGY